jgi:putative redox protein
MEKVLIQSSIGEAIAGVIHRPEQVTEKLAVLCPGYLDTKDYDHLRILADDLAEKGYTVIRFDPTGTWDSGGSIAQYTVTQYLIDIKSVLEHMLHEHRYTDILLGGHSRGGMASILYAEKDSRITKILAIMPSSGRSSLGDKNKIWKETDFKTSHRDVPNSNEKKTFNVPYSHLEDRLTFNISDCIKNIHTPILLVAGERDELVLPEDVQTFFDQANEPKKIIIIDGIGHNYRHNLEQVRKVNDRILKEL